MTSTKKATIFTSVFALLLSTSLFATPSDSAQPAPQTARQALLEMFFSKTPGTFESHLPQATRAALRKAGTTSGASMLSGFSMLTGQLNSRGQQLQTFEAGPTLVLLENPDAHSKFEIDVERDDLRGDEDEIELSFHGSKDGETQTAGAKFRLTLTMKQEAGSLAAKRNFHDDRNVADRSRVSESHDNQYETSHNHHGGRPGLGRRPDNAHPNERNDRSQRIRGSWRPPHAQYG